MPPKKATAPKAAAPRKTTKHPMAPDVCSCTLKSASSGGVRIPFHGSEETRVCRRKAVRHWWFRSDFHRYSGLQLIATVFPFVSLFCAHWQGVD